MERKNNELVIIPKIEKYIEYILTILMKLPRTEKFVSILKNVDSSNNSIKVYS